MGSLKLRDLSKEYDSDEGSILAVDDLSLDIQDGEFVVLVGPSGCGKSTTLRCIAGLESVSEGDVLLNSESIRTEMPKNRDIAMVFQSYALYPHKTAYGNMAFGLQMTTDLSEEEIREKVTDVAEMMGIEDLLRKKPGDLSGGQQQRVALGRAIVREPEVFLMDEPLSNLDAKLRTQMRTELQSLQRDLGITTVYVTHDQTEAMTMADRIVVLDGGELQQVGTPLECYHSPANRFVAGFIGSPGMNFIDVRNDGGVLEHESFRYTLSDAVAAEISDSATELTLGIRPEDIQFIGKSEPNSVTATVEVVEPMGDETIVNARIGDEQLTVSFPGSPDFTHGDQIELLFPEESIHLFDGKTGTAIVSPTITKQDPRQIVQQ
jgi:multiple sugar transport system ATP-binding protein